MSAVDVQAVAGRIGAAIAAAGTPERAAGSKAYLKSDLDFHGASVGDVRSVVRRERPGTRADLVALARALWNGPPVVFERRLAAALLLTDGSRRLELDDLAGVLEPLLRDSRTWALVDVLAGDCAGPLTDRLGAASTPVLDRWAGDADFWLRRSALLVHERPLRAGGGDWARFTRYADAMLEEREFFIRKAIGWVLRDTGRRRPDLVHDWLLPRAARAAGLTVREAVKHLPAGQRDAILAARSR